MAIALIARFGYRRGRRLRASVHVRPSQESTAKFEIRYDHRKVRFLANEGAIHKEDLEKLYYETVHSRWGGMGTRPRMCQASIRYAFCRRFLTRGQCDANLHIKQALQEQTFFCFRLCRVGFSDSASKRPTQTKGKTCAQVRS